MRIYFILILLLFCQFSFAQRIDCYSTLFEISDSSFVRIQYDNDLFQAQDIYYTQGVSLEMVFPVLKKNPVNKLFIPAKFSALTKSGIRIETAAFTPTSIVSDSILYNDRPYAAIMAIDFFQMSYQPTYRLKLSSELQLGMIGPMALGKEIQTGIHRITNNSLALGWWHQIKNDILLNYTLRFDKELLHYNSLIAFNTFAIAKIGSYQTNLSLGIDLSVGQKNNLYSSKKHKFQYYLYGQSQLKIMGYDASLMGGMFNHSSEYILNYSTINKLVAENHVGLVLQFPHVYFGVDFGWITKEFSTGTSHSWGGIRLGFY